MTGDNAQDGAGSGYGGHAGSGGSGGYGWHDAALPASHDYLAPQVLRVIERLGAHRVLDVGSGNGALCGLLAARGLDGVGVERDAEGVAAARRAWPQARFHQGSVDEDPVVIRALEPEPFDVAVSTEVVEHLYAPHHLPQFVAPLLKPGGHLVVTTPYHGYLKNLALALAGRWDRHHTALWHGGHIKFWSRATLTQLLEQNGFTVERFIGAGRLPCLWKSMLLVARKNR
jgi:2-polyprenyl-6-hydroxyphenyl methylase/3-demethylubiquinone-9 3-methyltransferase